MVDDEKLLAYLDGELDSDAARAVEEAIAADPALADRVAQHRQLRDMLRASFDPILDQPIPAVLTNIARPDADVIDLAAARAARRPMSGDWRGWASLAATLVLGLSVGYMLNPGDAGPLVQQNGRIVASHGLSDALDTQLASAGTGDAAVRVALTFRDRSGAVCRSFTVAAANGVACRDNGQWQVKGLFQGAESQKGDYRMAAGGDSRVMALVDDLIVGDPFDVAQERAARDAHWEMR